MLNKSRTRKRSIKPLTAVSSTWVRAQASGLLHLTTPLGKEVEKNATIGLIADPFGDSETKILSPASGVVIGSLQLPLVHQGDAVIHIAHLENLGQIDPVIEGFQEQMNDLL